ncbi:54S ribosomal protein yml6, mitochondrial [Vermiconidia calcicola]|uniref:54S ribosomal protein yml6, mitochondrial n=1 Tax=Vermiconidia calcicola TaxID=1690605 RepID=A0ACC3MTU5_9PEZI|nr:54S ribosomal protein yml6, mitochondrial [Vermiconidia calcicola]
MASQRVSTPAKHLLGGFRHASRHQQCRALTTDSTPSPNATLAQTYHDAHLTSTPTEPILIDDISPIPPRTPSSRSTIRPPPPQRYTPPRNPFIKPTHLTLHAFPTLEPTTYTTYPSTHLLLPLRKDILHRAIIYEADSTRQGSANTRWRDEVHGSGRKIRPQKGTGSARLGDKKSPMLKGGGVAFGPKPRDFSTRLQRAVYDLAWRTALSYRYARGELIVLEGQPSIPEEIHQDSRERWMRDLLRHHRMGHADGRTLFVTRYRSDSLWESLRGQKVYGVGQRKVKDTVGDSRDARALTVEEVDVKDLLELGRVVVERGALERMLRGHESDLTPTQKLGAWRRMMGGGALAEAT